MRRKLLQRETSFILFRYRQARQAEAVLDGDDGDIIFASYWNKNIRHFGVLDAETSAQFKATDLENIFLLFKASCFAWVAHYNVVHILFLVFTKRNTNRCLLYHKLLESGAISWMSLEVCILWAVALATSKCSISNNSARERTNTQNRSQNEVKKRSGMGSRSFPG